MKDGSRECFVCPQAPHPTFVNPLYFPLFGPLQGSDPFGETLASLKTCGMVDDRLHKLLSVLLIPSPDRRQTAVTAFLGRWAPAAELQSSTLGTMADLLSFTF